MVSCLGFFEVYDEENFYDRIFLMFIKRDVSGLVIDVISFSICSLCLWWDYVWYVFKFFDLSLLLC